MKAEKGKKKENQTNERKIKIHQPVAISTFEFDGNVPDFDCLTTFTEF